jgi:hypothetical protein
MALALGASYRGFESHRSDHFCMETIADKQKQIEELAKEYISWHNLQSDAATVKAMENFVVWAKTRLCVQLM